MNELMKLERNAYLRAESYQRTESRRDYANGVKGKRVKARVGELSLDIPQTRETDFYPSCLKKGLKSERALRMALAEAYVQGVSTRKMAKLAEELCGTAVSSSQVSRAAVALDETLAAWRESTLGAVRYVHLDARYEKVRHGGRVVDCAFLLAIGVDLAAKRTNLGVSVALSEQEVHLAGFSFKSQESWTS